MKNRYIVIMAGGAGTRFWPYSREAKPKQFLDILNSGTTLLQDTVKRFEGLCPLENILIVTGEDHRELVASQVALPAENILTEPMRRNTAPCVAYAAFTVLKRNPDALMVVSPADHHIKDEKKFRSVIEEAFEFAGTHQALLTLGMRPNSPETGYGYIQANTRKPVEGFRNLMEVKTFTEKPDKELAQVFLDSGDFYWNSGIFIWSAKAIEAAFEKHLPDMYATFDEYRDQLSGENKEQVISKVYSQCTSISIDYGIMEKAENVYVKFTDFGWSDLGTWGALPSHMPVDSNGNSGTIEGLFDYELSDNIIKMPEGKVAVIQGLHDYIIVDSGDVLMIVRRDEEQNIKRYIEDIRERMGEKYL